MQMQQPEGLQERFRATLTKTASSHAEADGMDAILSKPLWQSGRVISPWHRPGARQSFIVRIAVVDTRGVSLMPCTPAKARHLFKQGKARPKRNKFGLFYVQLCYEQEPTNQLLAVGVDPGSSFEGY
jgi:hypothetical protein